MLAVCDGAGWPGQAGAANNRANESAGEKLACADHSFEHRPGKTGLGSDDAVTVRHHGAQPYCVWGTR